LFTDPGGKCGRVAFPCVVSVDEWRSVHADEIKHARMKEAEELRDGVLELCRSLTYAECEEAFAKGRRMAA
jgi:hypothetical protein